MILNNNKKNHTFLTHIFVNIMTMTGFTELNYFFHYDFTEALQKHLGSVYQKAVN